MHRFATFSLGRVTMGISGLLPGLKDYTRPGNISDYAGQAVAVDASSWFHKSVYSMAEHYVETVETRQTVDDRCIDTSARYFIQRCEELLTFAKLKQIYLVLDGARCPLKAVTHVDREQRRREQLALARQAKQQQKRARPGRPTFSSENGSDSYKYYKACIKVHPDLTQAVARILSKHFDPQVVTLIGSPYEADAQMVQLCRDGRAQAVITEDSDVLVYAAACQASFPVLFKLHRRSGQCEVISMDWLISPSPSCTPTPHEMHAKKKGLEAALDCFVARQSLKPGLGVRLFVQSCILSGCDYCPDPLPGVGTVNAFARIRREAHWASDDRFRQVLAALPKKTFQTLPRAGATRHPQHGDDDDPKQALGELLAKCEAVFYYHPVRRADGQVGFLCDPAAPDRECPSLERFQGDLSFLVHGDLEDGAVFPSSKNQVATTPLAPLSAGEVPTTSNRMMMATAKRMSQVHKVTPFVRMLNPYGAHRKRPRPETSEPSDRPPLQDQSPNLKRSRSSPSPMSSIRKNPFADFALHHSKENENMTPPANPPRPADTDEVVVVDCTAPLVSWALQPNKGQNGSEKLDENEVKVVEQPDNPLYNRAVWPYSTRKPETTHDRPCPAEDSIQDHARIAVATTNNSISRYFDKSKADRPQSDPKFDQDDEILDSPVQVRSQRVPDVTTWSVDGRRTLRFHVGSSRPPPGPLHRLFTRPRDSIAERDHASHPQLALTFSVGQGKTAAKPRRTTNTLLHHFATQRPADRT